MEIGNKIKEQRSKQKMTQQELADKIAVSRATISSWEVGRTYPDLQTTVLLSNTFNVSLDYLLREEIEMMKDIDSKVIKSSRYQKIIIGGSVILGIILLYSLIWGLVTQPKRHELKQNWEAKTGYYQKENQDITFTTSGPTFPLLTNLPVEGQNNNFRVNLHHMSDQEGIAITLLNNDLLSNLSNHTLTKDEQLTIMFDQHWTDYNIGLNKQGQTIPENVVDKFVEKYKAEMQGVYFQTLQQWSDINL